VGLLLCCQVFIKETHHNSVTSKKVMNTTFMPMAVVVVDTADDDHLKTMFEKYIEETMDPGWSLIVGSLVCTFHDIHTVCGLDSFMRCVVLYEYLFVGTIDAAMSRCLSMLSSIRRDQCMPKKSFFHSCRLSKRLILHILLCTSSN
jgi:hypothetical protein